MSSIAKNEDLRSVKTRKSLYAAMYSLLKKHNFRKITIKGICEEAIISRATFYAHFIDKYDLLKHWLAELWTNDIHSNDTYEQIEEIINGYIRENMPILKNVVYDADDETVDILFDFILSTVNLRVEKDDGEELYHKNIVLSNFYAGGILSYLLWQVKNKFPPDIPPMNRCLYDMIHNLLDWKQK